MKQNRKSWHFRTGWLPILLGVLAVGGLLLAAQPAAAQSVSGNTVEGSICMQRLFIGNFTGKVTGGTDISGDKGCTSNDIRIGRAISAINNDTGDATCIEGTTFTLLATFEVDVTATTRYDAGFIFRIDGGLTAKGDVDSSGNVSGTCSLSVLTPGGTPGLQLDNDSCGDLTSAGSPFTNVTYLIPSVTCVSDGAGNVRLPNCVAWHNNAGTVCSAPTSGTDPNVFTLAPETKSKCECSTQPC